MRPTLSVASVGAIAMPMLRADVHGHAVELEGLLEERGQSLREPRRVLGIGVDEHGSELVTADPDQDVSAAQRAGEARAELTQQLVARGVTERVVDLLEMVEVDEQEREVARRRLGVGVVGEVRVEQRGEAAPVSEPGQLIGHRLSMAFLGERAQAADGHGEADTDDDQGCHGQADRGRLDLVGIERADEQDHQGGERAQPREQEAGHPAGLPEVATPGWQPHRDRHHQDGGRPCDRINDLADRGRVRGREVQEVERVADAVDRAGAGEDHPREAAPGKNRRSPDDEREQEHVADRVGQVDGDADWRSSKSGDDPLEGEGSADSSCPEACHPAVEPGGREETVDLLAEHQDDCCIRQREEAEVERIGEGWVRRRSAVPGLPRQHRIAERPREHRGAEDQRDGATWELAEAPGDEEPARDEFERDHAPAVDPWPIGVLAASDQAYQVCREEHSKDAIDDPEHPRRARHRTDAVRGQLPFTWGRGAHPRSFAHSLSNSGCDCGTTMIPVVQVA